MSEPIECCFKGCSTVVWAPAPTELKVICSSATCIQCKHMVFCLDHFTDLYHGHPQYECPYCGESQWWVALFQPAQMETSLVTEVQRQGGVIESKHTALVAPPPLLSHDVVAPPPINSEEPALRDDPLMRPASHPTLEAWTLMRNADLPPGFSFLGPGVAGRLHSKGMDVIANRSTYEVSSRQADYIAAACSRSGRRLVLVTKDAESLPVMICHDASHATPITLRPRPASKLGVVIFIDEVRFAYLVVNSAQHTEIFEGSFDSARRIRSRRIADLGLIPDGPGLIGISQRREVLVTGRRHANHFQLIGIRLADSQITPIAELGAKPRRMVAAEDAQTVAWISLDGEIRHGGIGKRDKLIGRTDENLLAISADGTKLAWVNGNRLETADLHHGTIHQKPVRPGVLQITAR